MSIKDIFTKDYYEKLKKKLTTKKNYRYFLYFIILILVTIACYEKFVIYRLEAEILKRDYSIRSLKEHNSKLNTIIEEGRMPSYLDKPD
nr:MAG TPA: Septum formation initiator [Caudoviricetes sp.]